jgi:hypothetical protein
MRILSTLMVIVQRHGSLVRYGFFHPRCICQGRYRYHSKVSSSGGDQSPEFHYQPERAQSSGGRPGPDSTWIHRTQSGESSHTKGDRRGDQCLYAKRNTERRRRVICFQRALAGGLRTVQAKSYRMGSIREVVQPHFK